MSKLRVRKGVPRVRFWTNNLEVELHRRIRVEATLRDWTLDHTLNEVVRLGLDALPATKREG